MNEYRVASAAEVVHIFRFAIMDGKAGAWHDTRRRTR